MDPGTGWNQPSGRSRNRKTGGNPKRAARCARVGRPGTAPSRGLARVRGVRRSARRARMPPGPGRSDWFRGPGAASLRRVFEPSEAHRVCGALYGGSCFRFYGRFFTSARRWIPNRRLPAFSLISPAEQKWWRCRARRRIAPRRELGLGRRPCRRRARSRTIAIRRAGSGDSQTVGTDLGGESGTVVSAPRREAETRAAAECRPAGGDRPLDRAIAGPGGGVARLGGQSRSAGCTIPLRYSRRTAGNGAARDRREAASGAEGGGQGDAERVNRDYASGITLESACHREAPREQRPPKWIKAVRRAANCGKTSATGGRWASACGERHCQRDGAVLRRSCPGIWLWRIRAVAVFG